MNWWSVIERCRQVPALWSGEPTIIDLAPPAKPWQIEKAEQTIRRKLPDEYREFLEISNGGLFFPWEEGRGPGIWLYSVPTILVERYLHYLDILEMPRGTEPFFLVGEPTGFGDYLAVDDQGVAYVLSHEYPPEAWLKGKGVMASCDSLKAFLLRMADERGRWFWGSDTT